MRGERGIEYEDVYYHVAFLPRCSDKGTADSAKADGSRNSGQVSVTVTPDLKPASLAPELECIDYFPGFMPINWIYVFFKRKICKLDNEKTGVAQRNFWGKKVQRPVGDFDVPLEIMYVPLCRCMIFLIKFRLRLHLSAYYNFLLTAGLLKPAAASLYNCDLRSLQDASAQLRRIASTPSQSIVKHTSSLTYLMTSLVPFAYQAHLHMAVWLYLIFLPVRRTRAPIQQDTALPASSSKFTTSYNGLLFLPQRSHPSCTLGSLQSALRCKQLLSSVPINYNSLTSIRSLKPTVKTLVRTPIPDHTKFELMIFSLVMYDENDLDLDLYCTTIAHEIKKIVEREPGMPSGYNFSNPNQQFGPSEKH